MTDRHAGYLITLTDDIREDDAEAVMTALRMVRGVLSVEPVVSTFDLQMAQSRARGEMQRKIVAFLRDLD